MTLFSIETERLLLRRVSPDDLDAIAGYQALPEVPRWMAMDGLGEFVHANLEDDWRKRGRRS